MTDYPTPCVQFLMLFSFCTREADKTSTPSLADMWT